MGAEGVFLSAPGFRDAGYNGRLGGLVSVGHYGYSWSSTVSSTNGMNLTFGVTWLIPSTSDYRGYGFQLRCLSE